MLYHIKFRHYPSLWIKDLLYDDCFLVLAPNVPYGEVLSEPLAPKLGYQWQGFNIEGSQSIQIAFASTSNPVTYFSFKSGSLQSSDVPEFLNVSQIRARLLSWQEDVRLLFRLTRNSDGSSPYISGYAIGCKVLGDFLSYFIEYGLPSYLRKPYPMERLVFTDDVGAIAVPSGFTPSKISGTVRFITIPEKKVLIGSRFTDSNLFVFKPVLSKKQGYLMFNYTPAVEGVSGEGLVQVSEIPSIFARYIEDSDVKHVQANRWVTSNTGTISETIYKQRNIRLELRIVAQTIKDVRMIACSIYDLIRTEGSIFLPSYAQRIPLRIVGSLREMQERSQISMIKESLASATLLIEIINSIW